MRDVRRVVKAKLGTKYDEIVDEREVRKQHEMIRKIKGDRWFMVNHASVEQALGRGPWSDTGGASVKKKVMSKEDEIYQRVFDGTYEGVVDGGLDEDYPAEEDVVEARTDYTELRDKANACLATVGRTGRRVTEEKDVVIRGPRV